MCIKNNKYLLINKIFPKEEINSKCLNITRMFLLLSVNIHQENNCKYHRFSCTIENIEKNYFIDPHVKNSVRN